MEKSIEISFGGQIFKLLSQKVLFHNQSKSLLIADLHLGKISHFRKAGLAIPIKAIEDNFNRLTALLEEVKPNNVIILGDLFHSTKNNEWDMWLEFMQKYNELNFELIIGNHDILPPLEYEKMNISMQFLMGDITLSHHPIENLDENNFNICGHLHPSVIIRGKGRQILKLPCFYISQNTLTMPAFGTFTGTAKIKAKKGDIIYGISNNSLYLIDS